MPAVDDTDLQASATGAATDLTLQAIYAQLLQVSPAAYTETGLIRLGYLADEIASALTAAVGVNASTYALNNATLPELLAFFVAALKWKTDALEAGSTSFLSGSGAPADTLGVNGDTYMDTATGSLYTKSGGTWSDTGDSLIGPTGAAGGAVSAGTITETELAEDSVTLAKIADAALSGSDATLITGTAGAANHGAMFDASGDLIQFLAGTLARPRLTGDVVTAPYAASYAASWTPDMQNGSVQEMTLTGNVAVNNPTNLVAGQWITVVLRQDATGGRTGSWGSYWEFPNKTAPTLSTGANEKDTISGYVLSATEIICSVQQDFG